MSLFALGPWPYGYYMLLRVVVFAAALLLAILIHQRTESMKAWAASFVNYIDYIQPTRFTPLNARRVVDSERSDSMHICRSFCDGLVARLADFFVVGRETRGEKKMGTVMQIHRTGLLVETVQPFNAGLR